MADVPTNVEAGAAVTGNNMKMTSFELFKRRGLEIPETEYIKIRSGKRKGDKWQPIGLDEEVAAAIKKILYKDGCCFVRNDKTGATVPISLK